MTAPSDVCTSCQTPLPSDAQFCPRCGAATPTQISGGGTVVPVSTADQTAERSREIQAAIGPDFVVERCIGRGGFAEVWAATDTKLQRQVAVKVLHHELVGSRALIERFMREAQAVAKLRHPGVIPIYAVGQRAGLAYYVMPLVEGESLRERLSREGALPPDEVRRILRDAAAALDVAHEAGIVHRDVKPENLMLEGKERRVLVMDFGIAKSTAGVPSGLTGSGMIVGTPAYMSPEQATGSREIDARSDVYSLGVVGFELLTGKPPFKDDSVPELMVQHISTPAPSVSTLRPDTPANLALVIDRCLAKDPAARWADATVLMTALDADRPAPTPVLRRVGVLRRFGGRPRLLRIALGGVVGLAAVAVPVIWFFAPLLSPPRIEYGRYTKSLAVLYFDDRARDQAGIHIGDALTEELISRFGRVRALRVVPPLDVVRFRNGRQSTDEIGRTLGVDVILVGTVNAVDSQLEISAQLLDAEHGFVLWSDALRGGFQQLFAMQDSVTRSVVNALSLQLSGVERREMSRSPTTRFQAYQLFLRGHGHLARWTAADVDSAIALLTAAVQDDSAFAEAHAYLAFAYLTRTYFGTGGSAAEGLAEVGEHSARALALDPGDEVALVSSVGASLLRIRRGERLGLWRLRAMTVALKRIVRRNPDSPLGNLGMAHYYMWVKSDTSSAKPLLRHALSGADAALRVEPQNQFLRGIAAEASGLLAIIASSEGNVRGAIELSELSLGFVPDEVRTLSQLARFYEEAGQLDRAIGTWRLALSHMTSQRQRGRAYVGLGATLYRAQRVREAGNAFATAFGLLDSVADGLRDYAVLYWAALAPRLGDTSEVQRLLRVRADGTARDSWIGTVLRYAAGQLDDADVIRAAKRPWQRCEGYYFLGARALQRGRTADARRYFESSVATRVSTYLEYGFAGAELEVLRSTP